MNGLEAAERLRAGRTEEVHRFQSAHNPKFKGGNPREIQGVFLGLKLDARASCSQSVRSPAETAGGVWTRMVA